MSVIYQNNIIVGSTKVGSIKKDANGYREIILGAFNCDNSGGAYYPLEPVKNLLLSSSPLMRRIKKRALRSEYGHPRQNSMNKVEFLIRVLDILEERTCNHILKIELDENRITDPDTNTKVAAIVGWVLPSGPFGDALEKQFENPEENVCYSIRSITNDQIDHRGKVIKSIKEIVTWDYVNEGGIKYACKQFSPALESISDLISPDDQDAEADFTVFDEETILIAQEYAKQAGFGNESLMNQFDRLLTKNEVKTKTGLVIKKKPNSRWKL